MIAYLRLLKPLSQAFAPAEFFLGGPNTYTQILAAPKCSWQSI